MVRSVTVSCIGGLALPPYWYCFGIVSLFMTVDMSFGKTTTISMECTHRFPNCRVIAVDLCYWWKMPIDWIYDQTNQKKILTKWWLFAFKYNHKRFAFRLKCKDLKYSYKYPEEHVAEIWLSLRHGRISYFLDWICFINKNNHCC